MQIFPSLALLRFQVDFARPKPKECEARVRFLRDEFTARSSNRRT